MGDLLVPTSEVMTFFGELASTWVAWGVGLSIVFWTLGYCVWFIIQFFR